MRVWCRIKVFSPTFHGVYIPDSAKIGEKIGKKTRMGLDLLLRLSLK